MLKLIRVAVALSALAISSLAVAQDYRYYGGDYRYDVPVMRIAHDFGFQDGARVARQDMMRGKPYQPYPRHNPETNGYRRSYGDKYAYMAEYSRGYEQGYKNAFRR